MIVDMHVHTNRLSSCSELSPEEAILRAKRKGLDGVCFTEHDALWDKKEIARLRETHDFGVFQGIEVTTNYGHILVYGLDRWDKSGYVRRGFAPYFPLMELKKIVKQSGAFMVVTYPFREPGYLQAGYGCCRLTVSLDDILHRPIFGLVEAVEGFNGQSCPEENKMSFLAARALGLPVLGGSDAHSGDEVGRGATAFIGRFHEETELLSLLESGQFQLRK